MAEYFAELQKSYLQTLDPNINDSRLLEFHTEYYLLLYTMLCVPAWKVSFFPASTLPDFSETIIKVLIAAHSPFVYLKISIFGAHHLEDTFRTWWESWEDVPQHF